MGVSGSRELAGDTRLYGVRGQLVIVKAPTIKHIWRYSNGSRPIYIVPRVDGTVVLGGTFEIGQE